MIVSIPGHVSFGLFMGMFYGKMKEMANKGKYGPCVLFAWLALIVPILIHGFFDFCLFLENILAILIFVLFIIVVDIISVVLLIISSKKDKKIVEEPQQIAI